MDSDVTLVLPTRLGPNVKILFYTTFDNGVLVEDVLSLYNVLPDKASEVVVSVMPTIQEPGKNVTITVKGNKKVYCKFFEVNSSFISDQD